ncbi:hypothetical protein M413DRAFT_243335 [Hebeloma cylindrosporum]|uniref:Uncharacterized protein n=1 Tax=Hebeloma cylindrosporum TaxID=76867 RepID=A0A0C3C2Q3_HEBCY|nr:hypothetical protein M413DRAFT_243335 [Hebeloma cylindrosporum h7]
MVSSAKSIWRTFAEELAKNGETVRKDTRKDTHITFETFDFIHIITVFTSEVYQEILDSQSLRKPKPSS